MIPIILVHLLVFRFELYFIFLFKIYIEDKRKIILEKIFKIVSFATESDIIKSNELPKIKVIVLQTKSIISADKQTIIFSILIFLLNTFKNKTRTMTNKTAVSQLSLIK